MAGKMAGKEDKSKEGIMIKAWIVANQIWLWIVGVIITCFIAWYIINGRIEAAKLLAVAQEKEKQVQLTNELTKQKQKELDAYVQTLKEAFTGLANQQAEERRQNQIREQKLSQQLQELKKPKDVDAIIADVKKILGVTAEKGSAENTITLPAAQVQECNAYKVENDSLKQNIDSLKLQLALEEQKRVNVEAQLDKAMNFIEDQKALIQQYKDVADAYKKAAVKSKWKRAFDFARPIAIGLVVGVLAGQISK